MFKKKSVDIDAAPAAAKQSASLKDKRPLWFLFFALAIIAAFSTWLILNTVSKQDTYYVLSHAVAAQTKITTDDVTAQTLSGQKPPNALTVSDIQQGNVYSKYPLNAGDVLAGSNAGTLDSLNEGIPDNWVITSFTVASNDMPTSLQRSDYFDMIVPATSAVSDAKTEQVQATKYLFRNVMVLQTSATTAGTTNAAKNGQAASSSGSDNSANVTLVVGMSPKNAAILQTVMNQNYNVKLVISPKQTTYQDPTTLNGLYDFDYQQVVNDAVDPAKPSIVASQCTKNNGEDENKNCTDSTFTTTKRDAFGVPYNAKASDLDKNGDVKKLTDFEKEWCQQLYSNDYYNGSKWESAKAYCAKGGVKSGGSSAE